MARVRLLFEACLIFFSLAHSTSPGFCCPQYQKEALLQFRFAVLGNGSNDAAQGWWNSSSDCCYWEGVGCSTDQQQVTHLNLVALPSLLRLNFVLRSNILAPLFHLRTLESLDIAGNDIEGEIPPTGFANLTELTHLEMGRNNFNGSIPSELFSLTQLKYIYLDDNLFGGILSRELGNLTNLKHSFLAHNLIRGEIPAEIGNLNKLEMLLLSNNKLSGDIPSSIKNLTGLKEALDLSNNLLTGGIPPSIQNMSKLEALDLGNNLLHGEIPTWVFELEKLDILNLGGNQFTWKNVGITPKCMLRDLSLKSCKLPGFMPYWLSNQTNLYFLDLSQNNLEGPLPQWLAEMKLGSIDLSDNNLTGPLPPILFQSQTLFFLSLSRNNFSGQLPDSIGQASEMKVLVLSGNDFSGPIPKSISNISGLLLLDLSNNKLTNDEFPIFNENSSLVYADLSFNRLFGDIPATFPSSMEVLVLSKNGLSGVLPQNLKKWSQLRCLDLHDNNIAGEIPEFLSRISSLRVLNLRNNSLNGSILIESSNLRSLQILDLSENSFSGKIPSSLGNLTGMAIDPDPSATIIRPTSIPYIGLLDTHELQDLDFVWKKLKLGLPSRNIHLYTIFDLSNNHLSGEIPDILGDLKNLKLLNLSNNKLSGKIPMTFGDLKSLESLDLSHNSLSGEIPETFEKLLQLTDLDLSNNKLTGLIPSGLQMDRLNDPSSYANNSGLCGVQIQVPCQRASPPEPTVMEVAGGEKWFSWKMAAIGFPSGFMSTVLVMYVSGYFAVASQRRRQQP